MSELKFTDLIFTDKDGTNLPINRPARIDWVSHDPPRVMCNPIIGYHGNVSDVARTILDPKYRNFPAGLRPDWSIIHHFLGRPKE